MMGRYEAAIAGAVKDGGQTPEDVAAVILDALTSDSPNFRYQSSPSASELAGRKLVDVTGQSIVQATRALIT